MCCQRTRKSASTVSGERYRSGRPAWHSSRTTSAVSQFTLYHVSGTRSSRIARSQSSGPRVAGRSDRSRSISALASSAAGADGFLPNHLRRKVSATPVAFPHGPLGHRLVEQVRHPPGRRGREPPLVEDPQGHRPRRPGRRAELVHDRQQLRLEPVGRRVAGHDLGQHAPLQLQAGRVRLLVAGPLPGRRLARAEQKEGEVAGAQGVGHSSPGSLVRGTISRPWFPGSAPRSPTLRVCSGLIPWGASARASNSAFTDTAPIRRHSPPAITHTAATACDQPRSPYTRWTTTGAARPIKSVPNTRTHPATVPRTASRIGPSEIRNTTNTANSSTAAHTSADSSLCRDWSVPRRFHRASRIIVASPVEMDEARNSGDNHVVSLQTGWLVALRSDPVYDPT